MAAKQSKAYQSRAKQSKAEQSRANQSKAEHILHIALSVPMLSGLTRPWAEGPANFGVLADPSWSCFFILLNTYRIVKDFVTDLLLICYCTAQFILGFWRIPLGALFFFLFSHILR